MSEMSEEAPGVEMAEADGTIEPSAEPQLPCEFTCGVVQTKRCSRCKLELSLDNFRKNQHYCKDCQRIYNKAYVKSLPIERKRWYDRPSPSRTRVEEKRKAKFWQARLAMIAAYGGKCTCCGVSEPQFLTLEHLNGGGRKERRKFSNRAGLLYLDLQKRGWPSGYTVLCFNCNSAKGHYGVCPHARRDIQ
jgi:hypothetical protein